MIKLFNSAGAKFQYLQKLIPLFPTHTTYIEPFLGTGSVFLNKPKANYNILNDYNTTLYYLYKILENKETKLLIDTIIKTPIYNKILTEPTKNNILDVAKYLILSSHSIYGSNNTISLQSSNAKALLVSRLENNLLQIENKFNNCIIDNKNALDFLKNLSYQKITDAFIYLDPPYQKTRHKKGWSFKKNDLIDILDFLKTKKNIKVAISEYEDIKDIMKSYDYKAYTIDNSKFNKSNKVETLYVNYYYELETRLF